ncbi:N-acetyltransferase [Halobacillus fulvus]|nr:N-acetyltransferase [Halobacillus fulvus]
MSDIQQEKNRFYIGEKEDPKAEMLFETDQDLLVITSTKVKPDEREQGLGKELVDYAVNEARKNKMKIDPVCSFARDIINQTPEYQVVLNN